MQQHGMHLGTKYLTSHFVENVEFLAAAAARARTADELSRPLASLGIPSDVALIFDGVSIGSSAFSRHETLYLIGFTCMSAASQELGSFSGSSGRRGVSARSHGPAPWSAYYRHPRAAGVSALGRGRARRRPASQDASCTMSDHTALQTNDVLHRPPPRASSWSRQHTAHATS